MESETNSELIDRNSSTELAANRTAMAFQRTEMAADRTLMAIIRTSLALISFGFTIYEAFNSFAKEISPGGIPHETPKRFGASLIFLGVGLLILGLWNHWKDIQLLRERRRRLFGLGLMHHTAEVKVSNVAAIALLLLLVGVAAITRVVFTIGPL